MPAQGKALVKIRHPTLSPDSGVFDGTNARFSFGIPGGAQGMTGPPADLSGTSNNSNSVATLGLAVSDPPTQAQMQAVASKLDELILALRR